MPEQSKVVLITGSGQGIGRGIALEFAKRGYDVVLHDRKEHEGLAKTANEIQTIGGGLEVLIGDLLEENVPSRLVDETFEKMGRLDVLVNNAGITIFQSFEGMPFEQFNRGFKTDFQAPYLCAQRAAQRMRENQINGSIVNITSVHQERTNDGDSIYGPMKAALARATESMAYELAPFGIRVNAVAPGLTLARNPTGDFKKRIDQIERYIPLRRTGRASDIAKAVAWLVSDEASYITGITLRVDGGMNLPMAQAIVDGRQTFF